MALDFSLKHVRFHFSFSFHPPNINKLNVMTYTAR